MADNPDLSGMMDEVFSGARVSRNAAGERVALLGKARDVLLPAEGPPRTVAVGEVVRIHPAVNGEFGARIGLPDGTITVRLDSPGVPVDWGSPLNLKDYRVLLVPINFEEKSPGSAGRLGQALFEAQQELGEQDAEIQRLRAEVQRWKEAHEKLLADTGYYS